MKLKSTIIYEDDHLLVVNKPAFLLTIPDRYTTDKPNLYHQLQKKYGEVFVVHRLDKETSGIICFARTPEAHKHLSKQFQERTSDKYYYTLVEGNILNDEGIIDKAIIPNPSHLDRMIISNKGKKSITEYKVLERFNHFTFVEANIKTGRTHQIRIHFQAMGYPLVVDRIYGRREELFLSEIKRKKYRLGKEQVERPLISRTILHAYKLCFDHPNTDERVEFTADLPKDFSATVKQLRKWDV